jgi:hypothetical protein
VRALRLSGDGTGQNQEVSTLTVNVFTITNRCPVCGGAANSRYHPAVTAAGARVDRKCCDCGFTWDEKATRRSL